MKFKEFLKTDIIKFYEEISEIERQLKIEFEHNKNKINIDFFISEAVIEPERILINTYDEKSLNSLYNKYNIKFKYDNNIVLSGYYDKQSDIIQINYSKTDNFNEIEAMIGHEMVHKIQHKHSEKYFEQSERLVNQINENSRILQELFDENTVESMKNWKILREKTLKLYNDFLYNTVYEKMAYAYSEVKMNKNKTPSEIVKKLEKVGLCVDNKLKKYIGMYWLIKDKI